MVTLDDVPELPVVVVLDCASSALAAGTEIITEDMTVATESMPAIVLFILLVLIATVKSTFLSF